MQLAPLDGLQCFQIYQILIAIEKLAFIDVHGFCFPRTRINFFLDEGQGVPGDTCTLEITARHHKPQILDSD